MKKIFTFLAIGIASIGVTVAQFNATSGGPDDFGYSWVSSDDSAGTPNKPTYNWIDITTTGTRITGYGDDQGPGSMLNIGFDFPFYWYTINQFYTGANGYIRFTSPLDISSNGGAGGAFPNLPTNDDYNDWVCPFLCDLNPDANGGGKIYYETNNTNRLVVSYVDVPFWGSQTQDFSGKNTFQVIFSLVDTSITFQYKEQVGSWSSSYDANPNPVIVGIESRAGQAGLQVSNSQKPNEGLAVKFKVKRDPSFTLTDISLDWQKNDANAAVFGMVGKPTWINVNVANSGDANISSEIKVTTNVEKYVNGSLASVNVFKPSTGNSFTISSLDAGVAQEYTYPEALVPAELVGGNPSKGSYIISSKTTFADGVPTNNSVETELVILPNNLDSVN